MLIVSEVSEALEEYRNGHDVTETYYTAASKRLEAVKAQVSMFDEVRG